MTEIWGTVVDEVGGNPIPGASIELPDFHRSTMSNSDGKFTFSQIVLPNLVFPTSVLVRAPGYGTWTMENVLLIHADALIIDAQLGEIPVTISIPDMGLQERDPADIPNPLNDLGIPAIDQSNDPLPEFVRVRVTGQVGTCNPSLPYTVEVVEFKDYVKHVLPYEWIPGWPRESFRAGAMASKMYAWQIIAAGGRYSDADVYDSVCDQVYIPGATYSSSNNAIEFTWNWRLTHDDGSLFRTHYLDRYSRCEEYGWQGYCMGQWDTYYHATGNNGYQKLTWDEMIFQYYWDSELSYVPNRPPAGFHLHFYGNAWGDFDRVKILIDDPVDGGLPADIGDSDFTIEWWMRANLSDNNTPSCILGGDNWTAGNAIFDRDVLGEGDYGEYGVSLAGGRIAFGVNNGSESDTLCGVSNVADGEWHHIAITRSLSDGVVVIYIDGVLDAVAFGPIGDVSYQDGRTTTVPDQDPYLIIGARKSDAGPAFNGYLDEIRLSNTLRYTDTFQPLLVPFTTDANTMGLYHFDEGFGNSIGDSSNAIGGPSSGDRNYGGDPDNGPEWEESHLFLFNHIYVPLAIQ
jgi:hypothetical protein